MTCSKQEKCLDVLNVFADGLSIIRESVRFLSQFFYSVSVSDYVMSNERVISE